MPKWGKNERWAFREFNQILNEDFNLRLGENILTITGKNGAY